VKNVGKPCEGEPHARIDGRELETEQISGHGHGEEQPTGNRAVLNGSLTYHPTTPPRQLSTLHRTVVSKRVFNDIDSTLWWTVLKWADTGTRRRRTDGSWTATLRGSTRTGKPDGSSATGTPVPT
jgi:hypothetical protein